MKAVSSIKRRVRSNRRVMRVIIVAAAAGAICGFLFGGSVASADGPQPGGSTTPQTGKVARGIQGVASGRLLNTVTVQKYSAGPARPGVSQQLCDGHAAAINQVSGLKQEALNDYDLPAAEAYQHMLDAMINDALNSGCFVIE